MDSSIETGDPWEIPDPDPEPTPTTGGLSPLAEASGLFSRGRSTPSRTEDPPAPGSDEDEPRSIEDSAPSEDSAEPPEPTSDPAAEPFDSAVQELEEPPTFDLIPPSSFDPEVSEVFPTSPEDGEGPVDAPVFDAGEEESAAPVESSPAEVPEPPAEVPLDPWEVAANESDDPVEIEFGAPQTPEGSELPTGKATVTAGEGAISRPVLLTTETVEGANVAPVDIVVAVESVSDPGAVPAAVERALDALRARCSEAGGEAVVAVTTKISTTGSVITVMASGTAVNLL